MQSKSKFLEWKKNAVPFSKKFKDLYYSSDNGLEEAQYVFLKANNLSSRLRNGFSIAELGFGTGLNLLATLKLLRKLKLKGKISYTTFEAFPLSPEHMSKAHRNFPQLLEISKEFEPLWEEFYKNSNLITSELELNLIYGDARSTLPTWNGVADCWFLDGFAPDRNPELWGKALLQSVYERTFDNGTASTYSSAFKVRKNLMEVGFEIVRLKGFGRKKHMTFAKKIASKKDI